MLAAPAHAETTWSLDRQWDDGKAELLLYEAKPGTPRRGGASKEPPKTPKIYEALFITVKEDLHPLRLLKVDSSATRERSDAGAGSMAVLKLNQIHSYWTESQPQHAMVTLFVRRDDPSRLAKLNVSFQNWTGHGFRQLIPSPHGARLVAMDPYNGDEDRAFVWPEETLAEDQLPLFLRSFVEDRLPSVQRSFMPTLLAPQIGKLTVATITLEGKGAVPTGMGELEAFRVRVRFGEVDQTWWLESARPHVVVKLTCSDGRSLLLRSRRRAAYWKEPTFRPRE